MKVSNVKCSSSNTFTHVSKVHLNSTNVNMYVYTAYNGFTQPSDYQNVSFKKKKNLSDC